MPLLPYCAGAQPFSSVPDHPDGESPGPSRDASPSLLEFHQLYQQVNRPAQGDEDPIMGFHQMFPLRTSVVRGFAPMLCSGFPCTTLADLLLPAQLSCCFLLLLFPTLFTSVQMLGIPATKKPGSGGSGHCSQLLQMSCVMFGCWITCLQQKFVSFHTRLRKDLSNAKGCLSFVLF